MITIKDIAEAANVSPATVSRVINNGPKVGPKTREHVKAVMDKMGYLWSGMATPLSLESGK